MPQADILTFQPTLLLLPVIFLGGYTFFVTRWVPRIMLTLRARAWLTQVEATGVAALAVDAGAAWPEIFLMFVQFGGLVWVLSRLSLGGETPGLVPLRYTPPPALTFANAGATPVENFFLLWGSARPGYLFAPAAAEVTAVVARVLAGFAFFSPGRQFPTLVGHLRQRLARETPKLSASGTTPAGA